MGKKEPLLQEVDPERVPAFNRYLGMDRVRAGEGHAEILLDVREEFSNRRGVVHGGVIAALLDSALGAAVISGLRPEEWCGTVQLNVQFLLPGRGPRLTARARLQRRGLHLAFAEGTITDAEGRTVASAAGTWYVWPSRPK